MGWKREGIVSREKVDKEKEENVGLFFVGCDVVNGFGDRDGVEDFLEHWQFLLKYGKIHKSVISERCKSVDSKRQ